MCPIVPMFTCGLLRSNFSLAMWSCAPQSKPLQTLENADLFFALHLSDNVVAKVARHFRVMREMHGEVAAALRAAAQIGGVAEHFRQRHLHANHMAARAYF